MASSAMAVSAMAVNQVPTRMETPLCRGVSEGTGMATAADIVSMARTTLLNNDEAEQMQACECCGHAEECTRFYEVRVRSVFCGRYICGLCTEAVKEERGRKNRSIIITMEEALNAHMAVCAQFNRAARADPLEQLANVAEVMRHILRKSVEGGRSSPTNNNNNSSTPRPPATFRNSGGEWRHTPSSSPSHGIIRSTSCTPSFAKATTFP